MQDDDRNPSGAPDPPEVSPPPQHGTARLDADACPDPGACLRAVVDNIPDPIFITDAAGRFVYVSPGVLRALGRTADEVRELGTAERLFGRRLFDPRALEESGELRGLECEIAAASGERRAFVVSAIRIGIGAATTLYICRDVTERRQSDAALRQYENIVSSTPDGIALLDQDYRYVIVNDAYERFSGVKRERFLGLTVAQYLGDDVFRQHVKPSFDRCLRGEVVRYQEWFDYPLLGTRFVDVTYYPYRDTHNATAWVISNTRDITELKKLEQELVRLERLRATGEVAAGMSHNLNNILTCILGPAQLLKRLTDDPAMLAEIDEIIDAGRRARDLVHRLHLSVRPVGEDELGSVPLNEVIHEAVQASGPRWRDEPWSRGIDIRITTQLDGAPHVRGSGSELRDMLTNLIFNAVDAMPQGGTITIGTQVIGQSVHLRFRDTGTGMDDETRRRVFEPFFTTKVRIGTGLGLSMVHNTVIQWGGDIRVRSAPGEGTEFVVRLPLWAER